MTPEEYERLRALKDHPQLWESETRPRCPYCTAPDGSAIMTGLPGNACENCMNTGYADATIEDLK